MGGFTSTSKQKNTIINSDINTQPLQQSNSKKPKNLKIHAQQTEKNKSKLSLTIVEKEEIYLNSIMKSNIDQSQLYIQELQNNRVYIDQALCSSKSDLYQVKEQDFRKDPFHEYIGALVSNHPKDNQQQIKGTAVLISSNMILTSAHNFCRRQGKSTIMLTTNHKFYLGLNGTLRGQYQIQRFFYPEEFQDFQTPEYDYAVAKLKEDVKQFKNSDYLSLGIGFNDSEAKLSLFGYPCYENYKTVQKNGKRAAYQRGLSRKKALRRIQKNEISYDISTLPGQSGSPLITGAAMNIIVGLHKGAVQENGQKWNAGRYVNLGMILRMETWREKLDGKSFRVTNLQTNQQIALRSLMFLQMKKLMVAQLDKKTKLKCIYKRILESKLESIQTIRSEKETLESKNLELRSSIIEKNQDIHKIQTQKETLESKNLELRSSIIEKNQDIHKIQTQKETLESKNLELRSSIIEKNQDIHKIQTQKETLESQNFQLKSSMQNIKTEKKSLESQNLELRSSMHIINTQKETLESKNLQLKSFMMEKDSDLQKKASKIQQLEEISRMFKIKLTNIKKQIYSKNPEEQIQNPKNQSLIIKKHILQLQQTLRTRKQQTYREIMQQQSRVFQSRLTSLNSNYLIEWNPQSLNANKFRIWENKLEMIIDDNKYQIVSKNPLPKNSTSTVVFKMVKYGGQMQVCLGILCESRIKKQLSGRNKGSIGYFTQPSLSFGWINADAQPVSKKLKEYFIPQGDQLQIELDLRIKQLTFRNRKVGGGSLTVDLSQQYIKEKVYFFCNMYCKGDMIQAIY